jgi:ribulose kinase
MTLECTPIAWFPLQEKEGVLLGTAVLAAAAAGLYPDVRCPHHWRLVASPTILRDCELYELI